MMKKLTTITAAAIIAFNALALISQPATAQEAPTARVIVVDFQRVTQDSLVGKDIAAQMESSQVDLENRIQEANAQLQQEKEQLERQRSVMAEQAFAESAQQFNQKQQRVQSEMQQMAQQSRRALQQAQVQVERALRPIVRETMEKYDANMVLDKSIVWHHASGFDVTTEVIEKLDEKMPSYDVQLPDLSQVQ